MTKTKRVHKKYYRKQVDLFALIRKIKLWPSRNGVLHGVKSFVVTGAYAEIITHCNRRITIRNSKRSRAVRWLRNKWISTECRECRIPNWKLEKFSSTSFKRHYGAQLRWYIIRLFKNAVWTPYLIRSSIVLHPGCSLPRTRYGAGTGSEESHCEIWRWSISGIARANLGLKLEQN